MERATRKVLMSPEFMASFATRDDLGNRLLVNWRQPDADGWWEPIITTVYADNLLAAERARIAAGVKALLGSGEYFVGCGEIGCQSDRLVDFAAVLALLEPTP